MQLAQAVAKAKSLGIGICITEHWDYDYPTNPDAFHFDLDEYKKTVGKYRGDEVLLGIEIGMQPHLPEKNTALALNQDFDYVLCSIHCVKGVDIYEPAYYIGKKKQDVVSDYLTDMLACIKSHPQLDALAHIDYIVRYWPYNDELKLSDAPDLWDAVFKELAQREIPMEINTRRTDKLSAINAYGEILSRFKELGGKYFVTGSDAHNVDSVGRRIREAVDFGESIGLIPVYYKNRKKIPIR